MSTQIEVFERARYLHAKFPRHSMNEVVAKLNQEYSHKAVTAFVTYLAIRLAQRKWGDLDAWDFDEDLDP